ncbi:serine/threonine protein kinase [Massilia sp. DWR3-1-1]|uniref:serine/threonine protein kinase n=1 Tax=Massilia sp. DWR3-1-1 TaxID=2804559 RepID=UPI003CEC87C9
MNLPLHESANAILYRALDLPAGDRQQFIAQATAGEQALFDDVRAMLSRIEQLDQFLEDPLELPVEQKAPAPVLPRHGDIIGGWRVEQELGRNGADLILLVRREAGAGGELAFGTMRLAQAASRTGQTTTRFERLRERLAALDHPAIPAPVDGGITADGRPYFVVDRGAGMPIDRYCAQQGLDLAQRALLFASVCDAVHYLHQHLIVHRDLKSADMLVAPGGAVSVLDAGMIGDGWAVNPAFTSPDQLAGQPLSVSTDIYSLGAVLFSLLTGRYVHGVDAGGVFKTGGQVVAPASTVMLDAFERGLDGATDLAVDPFFAPADAAAAQARAACLRSWFDPILARALAAAPAQRYASAHALARELEQAAARLQADGAAVPAVPDDAAPVRVAPALLAAAADDAEPASSASSASIASIAAAPAPHSAQYTEAAIADASAAPRRRPLALAVAMLVAGLLVGVLAAPWLQQHGIPPAPRLRGAVTAPATVAAVATSAASAATSRPAQGAAPQSASFPAALALADSRRAAGDLAGAQQAAREALALTASVAQPARDQASADANLRLGAILAEQGHTGDGLAALRQALALHESHALMDNGGNGAPVQAARSGADVRLAIARVLAATGDDAGAEAELAAARSVYAAQLKSTPADAALHTGLLSIEMALAASQNAQKHGRDTVNTLAGLRRLAGASGDARIDLLEAYVQPRGTPEKAHAQAQSALARLRQSNGEPVDAVQARALAQSLTMAGEVGLRARQNKTGCANFDEAGALHEGLASSHRANAFDQLAQQRLAQLRQDCK